MLNKIHKKKYSLLFIINLSTVIILNYKILAKKSFLTGDMIGFFSSFAYQVENIFNIKALLYQNLVFGGFPYIGQLQKLTFEPLHYFSSIILNIVKPDLSSLYYFYEVLILLVFFLSSILVFVISKKIFNNFSFSSHLFASLLFLCAGASFHFLTNVNILFGVFYILLSSYLIFNLLFDFKKLNLILFCFSSSFIFASGSVDLYYYFSIFASLLILFSKIEFKKKIMFFLIYFLSFILTNGHDVIGFLSFSSMTNLNQVQSIGVSNYQQLLLSMNPLFGVIFGKNPYQVLSVYLIFFSFALMTYIFKEIYLSNDIKPKIIFLILFLVFALSSGYLNIIYNIFYDFLPLFSKFRNIHKLSLITLILICVLSSIFFEAFFKNKRDKFMYSMLIVNFFLGLYFVCFIFFKYDQSFIREINLKLIIFLILNILLIFTYKIQEKLRKISTYFLIILSVFSLRNDFVVPNNSPVDVSYALNENILDKYLIKNNLENENNLFYEIHTYYYLNLSKKVKQGPVYAGLIPYFFNENTNIILEQKPSNLKYLFYDRIFSSKKIDGLKYDKVFTINENQTKFFFSPTEQKSFYNPNYLEHYKEGKKIFLYELNTSKNRYLLTEKIQKDFISNKAFSRKDNCLLQKNPLSNIEDCIYVSKNYMGNINKIVNFVNNKLFSNTFKKFMPKEIFYLNLSEEKFVLFPVINFNGWEILINGEENNEKIFSVYGTFIGTNIKKGSHKIELIYKSNLQILFYFIYNIFIFSLFLYLVLDLFKFIKNYFFRRTII